jgi:anion-transporting  ArsA/GET3 family ATPase
LTVNDDRLSVLEAERARDALQQAGISIPAVIVNRVAASPEPIVERLGQAFPGLAVLAIPDCRPAPHGLAALRRLVDELWKAGLAP